MANLFCEIPMSVLVNQTGTYRLPLGRLIQAKVAAKNLIGFSVYSTLNVGGELAQTEPLKPVPPLRNTATSQT